MDKSESKRREFHDNIDKKQARYEKRAEYDRERCKTEEFAIFNSSRSFFPKVMEYYSSSTHPISFSPVYKPNEMVTYKCIVPGCVRVHTDRNINLTIRGLRVVHLGSILDNRPRNLALMCGHHQTMYQMIRFKIGQVLGIKATQCSLTEHEKIANILDWFIRQSKITVIDLLSNYEVDSSPFYKDKVGITICTWFANCKQQGCFSPYYTDTLTTPGFANVL